MSLKNPPNVPGVLRKVWHRAAAGLVSKARASGSAWKRYHGRRRGAQIPATGSERAAFVTISSTSASGSIGGEPALAAPAPASLWPFSQGDSTLHGRIEAIGTGQIPVVFLHGLVGLNEHWDGVVRQIERRARCILFELPLLSLRGPNCSIAGVRRLTAEFLEQVVREPAVLVGNSFGGHVALRVASEHPELVRGLVLAGASGIFERRLYGDRDVEHRPSREWLTKRIAELFYDPANVREADVDRAFAELSQRGSARAMVKLSLSARDDKLSEAIAGMAVPTLLLWGRNDVVTPPHTAEEFNSLLPNSRLVWFDECGHAPMIERPTDFAREVSRFLDELSGGGAGR